jgi:hypothetical protein
MIVKITWRPKLKVRREERRGREGAVTASDDQRDADERGYTSLRRATIVT